MIVFAIIIAGFVVLFFTPTGIDIVRKNVSKKHEEPNYKTLLRLRVGLIKIRLKFSGKKVTRKETKKGTVTKKKKTKKVSDTKPSMSLSYIFELVGQFKDVPRKLLKRLSVKNLNVVFIAASEDAAKAALMYGNANAIASAVLPFLKETIGIKREKIRIGLNFNSTKPVFTGRIAITITPWGAANVLFYAAKRFLKILIARRRQNAKPAKIDI